MPPSLQRFWQWLLPQRAAAKLHSKRASARKVKRNRRVFLEACEERSLLATVLLQSYFPDNVGPQDTAGLGYSVAAGDNYYAVGAPSSSTSHADSGEVYVYDTAGNFVSRLSNPTPATNDNFGSAVAVSGNLVVAGAAKDDTGNTDSGTAYIFRADTGALLFTLSNPTPGFGDDFGFTVAIDGNLVAVGARGETTVISRAGAVHIFAADTGQFVRTITNPHAANGDQFGSAVALKGDTLVVGTPTDEQGASDSGRAYLINAATGALIRTLENPTVAAGDQFGTSVAIAGNYAVVSAPFDDGTATDAGAVHLFDAVTGDFVRTIDHPTAAANDQFGLSVSLNGDSLLVGTGKLDDVNGADVGRAFLFTASTGALVTPIDNPTPQAGDEFGLGAAIGSAGIVIGSWNDDSLTSNAGRAYLFDRATATLTASLANPTLPALDTFGAAVALVGDWYVVGSPGDDSPSYNSGKVRVYSIASGALVHEFSVPANSGEAALGTAVSVAGNVLAVGAPGMLVGGVNSGAVLLFDLSNGALLRTVENPTPAAGDLFGRTVALEGNHLIVGAPLDDTLASDNGAAYVFNATTGALAQTLTNPSTAAGDQFGFSVAVSSDSVAVGSPYNDQNVSNAGRAYLFNALTGALAQTLIASSNSNDYNLGYSIDIEGNTVVAGSPFGGTAWGRVQIFDATTGANTATLTDPSPNTNENFGYSVALSGNKLLVGVPGESSTGPRRGVVQLFDVPNRSFAQTIANPTPDSEDRFGDSVAGLGNLVAVGTTGDPGVNFREGAAYLLRQHSLSASLTSGELILADVGSSSTLTAVRDGDDLVVTEVSELFDANIPAGATLENNGRTLRMPIALFNKLRFNLGSGIDSLTLDLTGGDLIPDNSVVYDGGTNLSTASDSLTIVGGDQGAVTYFSFDANTGSVTLANYGVISYTGIESIRNTGDSTSATFSLPLSTNTTNLGAGGAGLLSFTSTNLPATFPATVLDNPSDTLTINRGTSADTISAGGFSTAPSIVLGTASNPFSAVNFTGAVNFAQDRNLTVYTAGTINFTLPASDLSLIGTGSASLTTARDIWLGNGASLKTKDGNINLTANITGGTTGNYSGVRVDSGAVVNALNGNVTVIGKGGTSGSGTNVGVYLNSVASEISTTNGILNVTGVGGGASGSLFNNLGVYVSNGGVISGGSTGVSTGRHDD